MKRLAGLWVVAMIFSCAQGMADGPHIIKTYLSFTYPVDPARIVTLVDQDVSYALAVSLVDWNADQTLNAGLAEPVDSKDPHDVVLRLKPKAKWSDGTSITAVEVACSFEHAKATHDGEMKSLFDSLQSIEPKDERTIAFRLKQASSKDKILRKLAEPFYGILFIGSDGKAGLVPRSVEI